MGSEWIIDFIKSAIGSESLGKVAILLQRRGYSQELLPSRDLTKSFVAAENESSISNDGATSSSAELVLLKFGQLGSAAIGKKVVGVQVVVA